MARNLPEILQMLGTAPTEQNLRLRFMDTMGEYFQVPRWGIYLMGDEKHSEQVEVQGIPNAYVELYQAVGRALDPIRHYVETRHAPAHDELVFPNGGYQQSELYRHCCGYYGNEHIMTGPVVGSGQLIGTIHLARVGSHSPAFDAEDLVDLGAICTHLSACLATLRTQTRHTSAWVQRLTAREQQIAELVAQGLTNSAVATQLWIAPNSVKQALKRMFRKLEVSSRTELVRKLYLDI